VQGFNGIAVHLSCAGWAVIVLGWDGLGCGGLFCYWVGLSVLAG
jgi:hypothetical protein